MWTSRIGSRPSCNRLDRDRPARVRPVDGGCPHQRHRRSRGVRAIFRRRPAAEDRKDQAGSVCRTTQAGRAHRRARVCAVLLTALTARLPRHGGAWQVFGADGDVSAEVVDSLAVDTVGPDLLDQLLGSGHLHRHYRHRHAHCGYGTSRGAIAAQRRLYDGRRHSFHCRAGGYQFEQRSLPCSCRSPSTRAATTR
jgi:hypothetical protein